MPSGFAKTSGNHFEIRHEQPWGGIASDKHPIDIEYNQLVDALGVIDLSGQLSQINIVAPSNQFRITTVVPNTPVVTIFQIQPNNIQGVKETFALDRAGNLYRYSSSTGLFTFLISAADAPWAWSSISDFDNFRYITIDGKVYISAYERKILYVFDPIAVTFNIATTYTAGKYLGILDDYMLMMDTNDSIDGLQPNRINWSGPGKFTTWDPAVDRTAGFNTIASSDTSLSGFIALANVGLLLSQNTLIQMTPNGVGIQPFDFATIWESEYGQGCNFPDSLAQYGPFAHCASVSGVFKVSSGGFQDVSEVAKKAIFSNLMLSSEASFNISLDTKCAGSILIYNYNSNNPTQYYVFAYTKEHNFVADNVLYIWFLNLKTGAWFRQQINIDDLVNEQYGTSLSGGTPVNLKIVMGQNLRGSANDVVNTASPINILIHTSVVYGDSPPVYYNVIATTYETTSTSTASGQNSPSALSLVFKANEIQIWRQPTFRRVAVKAFGAGDLALTVNGVSLGTITLDGTLTTKTYLSPGGMYTGESPQLTIISSNFKGVIVKVVCIGTFADGDID